MIIDQLEIRADIAPLSSVASPSTISQRCLLFLSPKMLFLCPSSPSSVIDGSALSMITSPVIGTRQAIFGVGVVFSGRIFGSAGSAKAVIGFELRGYFARSWSAILNDALAQAVLKIAASSRKIRADFVAGDHLHDRLRNRKKMPLPTAPFNILHLHRFARFRQSVLRTLFLGLGHLLGLGVAGPLGPSDGRGPRTLANPAAAPGGYISRGLFKSHLTCTLGATARAVCATIFPRGRPVKSPSHKPVWPTSRW